MAERQLHRLEGFKVVELHPSADPEKDETWLARESKKYPKDDFDREFLLKPVGRTDAYPVFSDWNKAHHEDVTLQYNKAKQIVYRGWDFGKVHPCVEFLQPDGRYINVFYEVYGDNIQLSPFASHVLADSGIMFPNAIFVDWGDASGVNERDEGRPSIKILADLGIKVKYMRREVDEGIAEIAKNVAQWDGGRPILKINPVACPHLADALRGGYRRNPKGEIMKDGTNDHPVDALRYAHQGVLHNINAQFGRSKPKREKKPIRPLTDCETYSQGRRI